VALDVVITLGSLMMQESTRRSRAREMYAANRRWGPVKSYVSQSA